MTKSKVKLKQKKSFKTRLKRYCILLAVVFGLILLITVIFYLFHLRINFTSSMPIGLYQEQPKGNLKIGNYVEVCLPEYLAKEGMKNGYIIKGICKNGSEPLIKEFIATPQDEVYLTDQDVLFVYEKDINGKTLRFKRYRAPIQKQGLSGQPIKQFVTVGTYHNDGYWVYGMYEWEYSWDSRYYGGIPYNSIISVVKPVWTI